jgi:hypothetical protein
MKADLKDFLDTLWNHKRDLKRLSNPTGKFQFVHFTNYNGNTFMSFTNNVQYIEQKWAPETILAEKKWTVYQVEDFIKTQYKVD